MKKVFLVLIMVACTGIGSVLIQRYLARQGENQRKYEATEAWIGKNMDSTISASHVEFGIEEILAGFTVETPFDYITTFEEALPSGGGPWRKLPYPKEASEKKHGPTLITFQLLLKKLAEQNKSIILENHTDLSSSLQQGSGEFLEKETQGIEEILTRSKPAMLILLENPHKAALSLPWIEATGRYVHEKSPDTKTAVAFDEKNGPTEEYLEKLSEIQSLDVIGSSFFGPEDEKEITRLKKVWQKNEPKEFWIFAAWNQQESFRKPEKEQQDAQWLQALFVMAQKARIHGVIISRPEHFFSYQEKIDTPKHLDRFIETIRKGSRKPAFFAWEEIARKVLKE